MHSIYVEVKENNYGGLMEAECEGWGMGMTGRREHKSVVRTRYVCAWWEGRG